MASTEYMNAVALANANATGFVGLAQGALTAATTAVNNVGYGVITWTAPGSPGAPDIGTTPAVPTLTPPSMSLPASVGAAPTATALPTLSLGVTPSMIAVAPVISYPTAPASIGSAPTAPTLSELPVFPTAPAELSAALPGAPTVSGRTLVAAPTLTTPTFSYADPTTPSAMPVGTELLMAQSYADMSATMRSNVDGFVRAYINEHSPNYFTQMTAIEAQLTAYLSGGTGLKPAAENAIYERARGKNNAEALRVRNQALNDAAARGFTMPTGALLSATQQARQAGADNNAKAAAEIVVMQAEMEQKNLQFAVTTASALHDSMRSAAAAYAQTAVSLNGQAMDYAKSVFANVVELYNSSLKYYSTQAEVFRTRASIFDTQLRAELAKLEVFKGQVTAFEAQTQADISQINLYNARLGALNTIASVFKSQVDAAVAQAGLQRLYIEKFQMQVQAFGAEVQAKNSEWAGYTARISGEEAKARVYGTQVSGYSAEVQAYRTQIDAQVAHIDAVAKTNQANVSGFQGSVQAYTSAVGAETTRAMAQNDNNKIVVTEYQKQLTAFMSTVNVELEKYKTQAQVELANATGNLSAQVESAKAKSQFGLALAQIAGDGSHVYGQLAGSAMAGMNTLAAMTETL